MAFTQDDIQQLRQVIREEVRPVVREGIKPLETAVNQMKTALEAVQAGQEYQSTKADLHDLKVELTEKVKNHERRIRNLEEETGTPNPYKH